MSSWINVKLKKSQVEKNVKLKKCQVDKMSSWQKVKTFLSNFFLPRKQVLSQWQDDNGKLLKF
jgi:hypothetical protein